VLVLSRREGEKVMIGDDVVVTVVAVRGDTVRLGIEAPRDVPVNRPEAREAVARANGASVRFDDAAVESLRRLRPGSPRR
jgi:carbon storage regulator